MRVPRPSVVGKVLESLIHFYLQVEEELPEVQVGQVSVRRHEALVGPLRRGAGQALQEDEGEEAAQVAGTPAQSFEAFTMKNLRRSGPVYLA